MKYFRLRHSIDPKIIGRKYPQVKDIIVSTTVDDPMFLEAFREKKAPKNILTPMGILNKSAKNTDLISASAVGFTSNLIVSNKLLAIIKAHKIFGVQFFQTVLYEFNTIEHQYWIIHAYDFLFESVDLNLSKIAYYDSLGMNKNLLQVPVFSNHSLKQEFEKYKEQLSNSYDSPKYLLIENLNFVDDADYDFFPLSPIDGGVGYFVSETLKKEIEKAGCSGMVFSEPNEPYPG
jgi:hypothetical protein